MSTSKTVSLAILGSYPPPYGGVGIHVQRLCPLLDQRGISYRVYNATGDVGDGERIVSVYRERKTWMLRYLFTAKEPAIYILSGRLSAWVIGALMASWRGKRVLLRLRNAALPDWVERGGWKKWVTRFALRRMSGIVCVSRLLLDCARRLGVEESRLHWSPGFLPPDAEKLDRGSVAESVWPFVERHEPVIAANGKVEWYRDEDLYGLDLLVELAGRLKSDYPNLGIVVCFWDHHAKDQPYLEQLMTRASLLGVEENICFNTRSGEFVPVLAASDLFIRPTNTDGDANSIREAHYLGIPAIASDAVDRPDGTLLFRTRNLDDLEARVRACLKAGVKRAGAGEARLTPDDERRIAVYLDLLAGTAGAQARAEQTATV